MELIFLRPSTSRVLGDRKNHYVKFCVKNPNIGVSSCVWEAERRSVYLGLVSQERDLK